MHRDERAEIPALHRNPAVALTIDTESHPPKVLLIRGRVELDVVDGIPEEYFQWNGTYQMTPEQRAEWEAGVRSLYDGWKARRQSRAARRIALLGWRESDRTSR